MQKHEVKTLNRYRDSSKKGTAEPPCRRLKYERFCEIHLSESEIMFTFRYTSSVCKHKKTILSYRMGQKIKLQSPVRIFAKYLWILQINISQGLVVYLGLLTTSLQIFQRICRWRKIRNIY